MNVGVVINKLIMEKDYSNKNLQKASFKNEDLSFTSFQGSDLRGTDFSGANLAGANFTGVKTGIIPANTVLIFLAALLVSLLSGYVAMLAGKTVQQMLASGDGRVKAAGITTLALIVLFIAFSWWRGVGSAIQKLILPVCLVALVIGLVGYWTGVGTGMGMLYLVLTCFLVAVMFIVGTVARAAAGTLSSTVIFVIVALGGGMFGKSLGGGIGTVIMAISCALISKKALSGASGFEGLRKIASFITTKWGTSFRNSKLVDASFLQAKLQNVDFTNADVSSVNWGDSKKINCLINENKLAGK